MFNLLGTDLTNDVLYVLIIIVGALIVLASLASGIISIMLFFKYYKFNRIKNSLGMSGKEIARKMLDENGLKKIRVKAAGSILFGNSYSHYFKKIRLRRLIMDKDTITSMSMASEKVALALLDKENDPDMKRRIKLVPLINFGPLLCIPIILVGVLIDCIIFGGESATATIVSSCLGIGFYALSFVLSLMDLKTEKKAQDRSIVMLKENNYATKEEIEMCKELFKLYNIEYINNMVLALLELIYRILIMLLKASLKSKDNN